MAPSWTLGLAGAALLLGASRTAAQGIVPHPTPETVTNTVAVHVPPLLRLSAWAPGRPVAPPWLTLQRETLATDRPRSVVRLTLVAR